MLEVFTDEPLDQALAKFQTYIDARTEDADKSALYALRAELLYQTCTFTCVNQILDDAKLADQLAPTATTALKVYQYGVWLDTVDSVKDYFYTAIDRDPEVIKKKGINQHPSPADSSLLAVICSSLFTIFTHKILMPETGVFTLVVRLNLVAAGQFMLMTGLVENVPTAGLTQ